MGKGKSGGEREIDLEMSSPCLMEFSLLEEKTLYCHGTEVWCHLP